MRLTADEHRALAFIAALLCLSAAVRLLGLPEPADVPGAAGFDLASHVEAVEGAVAEAQESARPLEVGETIDPNTATAAQLVRLPQIGPALAGRIVADRSANGPYRSLPELGRVPGVGQRTLELLAPHVGLPSASPGAARARRDIRTRSASRPGSAGDASAGGASSPVDVNRAGVEELTALPGIGPVLAARIVAYRDSAGPFRTLSDLTAVSGIGPATVARVAERVSIN
jgi:competence protein ComEA